MDVFDVVSARVSVARAKNRLAGRFAANIVPVQGTVIGDGLALVDGQLAPAEVGADQLGQSVMLQNAGRVSAAYYVGYTGSGAVSAGAIARTSLPAGGSAARIETIWPLLGGGAGPNYYLSLDPVAIGKPYATLVVAAADSQAPQAAQADYVCAGEDDQVQINAALAVGGRVLLLDGTYSLSGSVLLASGVALVGMGAGVTVLDASGAFDVLSGGELDDVMVSGITVTGAQATAGARIASALNCVVTECEVRDIAGVGVQMGIAGRGNRVSGNRFLACAQGGVKVTAV